MELATNLQIYGAAVAATPLLDGRQQEIELAKAIEAGVYASWRSEQAQADPLAMTALKGELACAHQSDAVFLDDLRTVQTQGQAAKEYFIKANLPLVIDLAYRYAYSSLEVEDLIQEGNIGLMSAVERFDYTQGHKFSTYATWWVRKGIIQAIADQGRAIYLPRRVLEGISELGRTEQELAQTQGRMPTIGELAAATGKSPGEVVVLLLDAALPDSIDYADDKGVRPYDRLVEQTFFDPKEATQRALVREAISEILDGPDIPLQDADIVRRLFGIGDYHPHTLTEVAQVQGLGKSTIVQRRDRTLAAMRGLVDLRNLLSISQEPSDLPPAQQ